MFADWLRVAMGEMTQEELASCVGVTQQAVSSWLNGRSLPTTRNVSVLAQCLERSRDEVMDVLNATEVSPTAARAAQLRKEIQRLEQELRRLEGNAQ